MATTTAPPTRPRRPERVARPAPTVLPPSGRQRRWSLALLAMLLTLGSGLLFAVLYLNAGDRVPVLTMARDVGQGETIARDDLAESRVSADPALDLVAAGDVDEIVGQTAAVALAEGSLLTRGQVGPPAGVQRGEAVVGVPVAAGDVPFSNVRAGMAVSVVFTPGSANAEELPRNSDVIGTCTIFNVEPTVDEGVLLVALLCDEDLVPDILTAQHLDQVSLALIGTEEILESPPADDSEESDSGSDGDSGEDSPGDSSTTSTP